MGKALNCRRHLVLDYESLDDPSSNQVAADEKPQAIASPKRWAQHQKVSGPKRRLSG